MPASARAVWSRESALRNTPAPSVMARWSDRQPVDGRVEADGAHRVGDGGEAGVEVGQPGGVEPQVVDTLLEHLGRHGPGHHVARLELVDEALAVDLAQEGAVATQGL